MSRQGRHAPLVLWRRGASPARICSLRRLKGAVSASQLAPSTIMLPNNIPCISQGFIPAVLPKGPPCPFSPPGAQERRFWGLKVALHAGVTDFKMLMRCVHVSSCVLKATKEAASPALVAPPGNTVGRAWRTARPHCKEAPTPAAVLHQSIALCMALASDMHRSARTRPSPAARSDARAASLSGTAALMHCCILLQG